MTIIGCGERVSLTYDGAPRGKKRRSAAGKKSDPAPAIPRLGDRIEAALESVGVTPERWRAAKAAIGLPATCRCAARKAWLDRLDETLGLGEKLAAFRAALRW